MSQAVDDASIRQVGLFGAMSIGIGGMVGGGIFAVLGEAVTLAHGATAVAFLVAGAIALLTAYSYAHLSVKIQSQGGTVAFIDRAFGVDVATGAVNNFLWLSYLVTIALYAVAFGSYGLTFFGNAPNPLLRHLLISAAVLLPIAINLFNAGIVSETETLIVVLKLTLLAVVIVSGFRFVDTARFAPATWGDNFTVVAAGMVIFVAYEGFELIANSAAEIRRPQQTLPRVYYGSVILVIILYVLVALVTTGTVPESQIAAAKDYALAEAAKPALGSIGFTLVAASALLATFSAINATLYGNARLGYTLAKDGELPNILAHKAWNEPVSGVLITGFLALLFANFFDLTAIAIIGSAGFLLIFAVTNAAAVRLARETGGKRWLSAVGCGACLAALIILMGKTFVTSPLAFWIFWGFLAFAALFELIYPRLSKRSLKIARVA